MAPTLRTPSGCSACRQRRKKCDELKPVCRSCSRRNLQCTWPFPNRIDRRRRDDGNSSFPDPALSPTLLHTASLVATSSDGDLDVDPTFLFQYCFKYFLPIQFHQPNFVVITDLSYLIAMCLDSLILRNSVAACAMTSVSTDKEKWQAAAQRYYLDAVQKTSCAIGDGSLKGDEDQLMASVNWLCVFENSQLEAGLHSGMHLKALAKLLLMRTTERCEVKSPAVRAWERSIFESFIYHSAVVTLFDSDFDPTEDLRLVLDKLSSRFHDVSGISDFEAVIETVFRSPTLGAPPEVFVTLIEATRQARVGRTLSFEEKSALWSNYYKIREWQSKLDMACELSPDFNIWMGKPYVVTVRLLLLYNILSADEKLGASEPIKIEFRNTMAEATALLAKMGDYLYRTWGKYLLWPLAIIGATTSRQADIKIVRDFIDQILKRSNSSTVLPVQRLLEERIWNVMREDDLSGSFDGLNLSGLHLILDSQVMGTMVDTCKAS